MVVLSGMVAVILIVINGIYDFCKRSTATFLWVSLFVFFGYSHLVTCISGEYSANILNEASLMVCIFCVLYLVVRIVLGKASNFRKLFISNSKVQKDNCTTMINKNMCKILLFILIMTTLLYFIDVMKYAGTISNISKNIIYDNRYASYYILFIDYMWSAGTAVLFLYLLQRNYVISAISGLCIIAMSCLTFTRTHLIILFVCIICYYIYNENINIRTMFLLLCFGIIAIIAMYLLRGFRYYYSFADIGNVSFFEIISKSIGLLEKKSGDIYLSDYFYQIILSNGRIRGTGHGEGYIRLLLMPFPSKICMGIKPDDLCLTLGKYFGDQNSKMLSITPTLFGDCYANFGFCGTGMGIVWAFIAEILDRIAFDKNFTQSRLRLILICSAYINIGRGDVYNAMAGIWYGIIIYYLLGLVANVDLGPKYIMKVR